MKIRRKTDLLRLYDVLVVPPEAEECEETCSVEAQSVLQDGYNPCAMSQRYY